MNKIQHTSAFRHLYVQMTNKRVFDDLFIILLLLAELVLGLAIIKFVNYTEIDWEAYMQEVEMWLDGEMDYKKIRGGTGPLVYPAGFLYLFAFLRKLTNLGNDIQTAQYIFLGFYLGTQATVLLIYRLAFEYLPKEGNDLKQAHQVWSWRIAMTTLCLSKRLHSIFLLRLFNDGPTMLLLYMSVLLFMNHRWNAGCVVFSLAVSIKMNVLLFAPGLLLLLLQVGPDLTTVILRLAFGCALPQLLLGAPFLITYPVSYLRKAFELDRVFFYKWTVNWKFLPEDIFVSKSLSLALLGLHLTGLAVAAFVWLKAARKETGRNIFLQRQLSPQYIAYTMLVSNFIGIAFARTLHYQFYVSYPATSISADSVLQVFSFTVLSYNLVLVF